ncbi:MAG: AGE family epimerase/isomerase [Kiritimatiellia bacterium]
MQLTSDYFIEHLLELNTWWEPFVDWEGGGIFANVERYSRTPRGTRKELLPHMRQMYNYSAGHERGHPRAESIARHLYETLDSVFPDREGALFLTTKQYEQTQWEVDAYMNAYVVLGLSRFARTFEERAAAVRALEVYRQLDAEFTHYPLAENGSWFSRDSDSKDCRVKSDNGVLHRCEAALNLYRALSGTAPDLLETYGDYLRGEMQAMVHFFITRIARPEEGYTVEGLKDDCTPELYHEDSRQSLAHGFEWIGFCFEMETHCGLTIDFLDTSGRLLVEKTLINGLAPNGCFRNDFVPRYRTGPQIATFWPQVEAPLGVLWARKRLGGEAFLLEKAERMLSFYRDYLFQRPEWGGGILNTVSENGIPMGRGRGHRFKCDHHAVRMCEKVLEYNLVSGDQA